MANFTVLLDAKHVGRLRAIGKPGRATATSSCGGRGHRRRTRVLALGHRDSRILVILLSLEALVVVAAAMMRQLDSSCCARRRCVSPLWAASNGEENMLEDPTQTARRLGPEPLAVQRKPQRGERATSVLGDGFRRR